MSAILRGARYSVEERYGRAFGVELGDARARRVVPKLDVVAATTPPPFTLQLQAFGAADETAMVVHHRRITTDRSC